MRGKKSTKSQCDPLRDSGITSKNMSCTEIFADVGAERSLLPVSDVVDRAADKLRELRMEAEQGGEQRSKNRNKDAHLQKNKTA